MTREEAIERMKIIKGDCYIIDNPEDKEAFEMAIQALSQEQKSGKWIDREEYDADRWKCSVCGRTEQYKENYCPNCGAEMESAK